jgi:hypothetical protein
MQKKFKMNVASAEKNVQDVSVNHAAKKMNKKTIEKKYKNKIENETEKMQVLKSIKEDHKNLRAKNAKSHATTQ